MKEIENNNKKKVVVDISTVNAVKTKGRWFLKIYNSDDDTQGSNDVTNFLYNVIKAKGPISRGGLTKLTSIPRTTIFDYLFELINSKKVEKYPVSNRKRGRPTIFYRIVV